MDGGRQKKEKGEEVGMPGKEKVATFLLSCLEEFSFLSTVHLSLSCPCLWYMANPTCHPSPRKDSQLPNQLLKLVTETVEKSLPFLLQKIVSHQGKECVPQPLHLGLAPAGTPLPSL